MASSDGAAGILTSKAYDFLFGEDDADGSGPERVAYEGQHIPVGYQTRIFLERGAATGEQRSEAVRATRNLLGAGYDIDDVIDKIEAALAKSPQDPAKPWEREGRDGITRMVIHVANSEPPPLAPFEKGEIIIDTGMVEQEEVTDGFRFMFPEHKVVLDVSRIVATSTVMRAWVRAEVDGAEVGAAECELKTSAGASGMWRFFEKWGPQPWARMLEQARRAVLKARREGGKVVDIGEVETPPRVRLRVSPLIVNGHLNVIFATGGSGKSLLMLLLASLIQEGRAYAGMTVEPGNVLYLDWEQGAEDAKGTLDALAAGMGGYGRFSYMRCTSTLVEMAEELGRIIVELDIAVVMIDSLTFALGGDKNDAQTVTAGTNAMRLWREGTTVIALDHVAKAQQGRRGGADPFGSVFVRNAARNLLKIEAWMDVEEHVLHQVIEQTKTNKGVLPVFGLKYIFKPESFDPSAIFVEEENPPFDVAAKNEDEKPAKASAPQREKVLAYIRTVVDRFVTTSDIVMATGVNKNTVKSCLEALEEEGLIMSFKHGIGKSTTYATKGPT